jgi:uncharacterized damage-inducible protein DinB
MTHDQRIADLTSRFDSAMARFTARVSGATAEAAERAPATGGWSVAQIAWHVGVINDAFCGLVDGSAPNVKPAPDDYVETPWAELISKVPDALEAPERFQPPASVTQADALARLTASGHRFTTALAGLQPAHARWTVKSIFGLITVYQVGEWAIAHVIRHNGQAKTRLE